MKKTVTITILFLALSVGTYAQEGFIGEVKLFAGNFAPRGWALCQGQLLAINQNQSLFSIIGTTYGGDGRTTFALPDLRGRAPLGTGSGPGLTPVSLGQKFGPNSGSRPNPQARQQNKQGSLGMNYIICLQGVYPSRN